MKLLTFEQDGVEYIGLYHEGMVINLNERLASAGHAVPASMEELIWDAEWNGQDLQAHARTIDAAFKQGEFAELVVPYESLHILPPISQPNSARDAYAFRQHVAAARRNRGVEMIPEFDQFPIFYFTNHNSFTGPGPVEVNADHLERLDFELEVAVVLGKRGKNIPAEQAEDYIFGFCIYNDWSARRLQMEEMKLNLGPAKGKDFANTIGPLLVTLDELEAVKKPAPSPHKGHNWHLQMTCKVNGQEVSRGDMGSMTWTFAEIIERVSYGTEVYPTDLIGSGTVGTGCFLELNGTAKLQNPDAEPQWLQDGDVVELAIEQLGELSNTVSKVSSESILAKKHNV